MDKSDYENTGESCCEEVHPWKLEGRRLYLMFIHRYFLYPPPPLAHDILLEVNARTARSQNSSHEQTCFLLKKKPVESQYSSSSRKNL